MEYLVTKSRYARLAEISEATVRAVSKHESGSLFHALAGGKVDVLSSASEKYLSERGLGELYRQIRERVENHEPVDLIHIRAHLFDGTGGDQRKVAKRAAGRKAKAEAPPEFVDPPVRALADVHSDPEPPPLPSLSSIDLPEDIRKLADLPLKEIVKKFGTDGRFLDWLNAVKRLEDLHAAKLKNEAIEKTLIPRNFISAHVLSLFESLHVRLLSDAPRTICARVSELCAAGEVPEVIEATVQGILSAQLKGMKDSLLSTMAKA